MSRPGHQFVVLAFRDSPYLAKCLASVCAQAGNSKVVVTTSTPSQQIADIAGSFGVPVRVREGESAIAADWNFGISCATEDLVTLAHQDDIYYSDFAEHTRQLFEAAPDASLCFTDYEEIDSFGNRLHPGRMMTVKRLLRYAAIGRREIVRHRSNRRRLLVFGSVIPCPTVTLNRKLLPGFRFADDYQIDLDWEAWLRLHALENPFLSSKHILMGHRIHSKAETWQGIRDGRRAAEDRQMFERIWPRPIASIMAAAYRLGY